MLISPGHATMEHCPVRGRSLWARYLCCLSCDGNATCSVRRRRRAAKNLLEEVEAHWSHHRPRRVEPSAAVTGSGRLFVLSWWLSLPWRILELGGDQVDNKEKTAAAVEDEQTR